MPTRRRPGALSFTGWLVAVVALALAVAGGATAGSAITGAQIKNNSVTTKDIKDGSLKVKDFKKSEAAKLEGTDGVDGAPGASAFAPPPAGTVIKGGGVLNSEVSSGGVTLRDFAPLPFATKTPILETGANRNLLGGTSTFYGGGEVDATKCPGTFTAPSAAPGVLCVYLGSDTTVAAGSVNLYSGATTGIDGADSSGFYLYAIANAAGPVLLRYVWAYTAN